MVWRADMIPIVYSPSCESAHKLPERTDRKLSHIPYFADSVIKQHESLGGVDIFFRGEILSVFGIYEMILETGDILRIAGSCTMFRDGGE